MKSRNRMKLAIRRSASRALVLAPLTFLLVAGAGCPSLFEGTAHRAVKVKAAIPGRDGTRSITGADTIVNAYAALTANAAAGATTVQVGSVADLTANFGGVALAKGDLLLVMQMQGATVDTTTVGPGYGAVTALNSAGAYEFVGVESVNATTNVITLACPLKKAYTAGGKSQVIRVPQYTTLTIAPAGSITSEPWDGTRGGVVAVHAQTAVTLNGSIDVSGQGFRGGAADNSSGGETVPVTVYFSAVAADGGEKGESIAGAGTGMHGRGARANGGGGGNSHNAGGGGGANAGDPAGWVNGQGVMLSSVTGEAAWLLDPGYIANSNARTSSQGGGRGGYSYSDADLNALMVGPDDATWGGNNRREVGGLGGRPLVNSVTDRLFMGGGGGAGDRNNGSTGSAGGNGGGIVFLITGTVTGAGSVLANGAAGPATPVGTNPGNGGDAPGGGGGGGAIVVNAATVDSDLTLAANGGAGGDQTGSSSQNEVEGPGGGGGGGYIAVSGGTPTRTANGGRGGTTNRTALSEFPSDGATAGYAGITNGSASGFLYCGALPVTTIATTLTNPTNSTTGTFTFTNTVTPVTYECKLDNAATFTACTTPFTTGVLAEGEHTLSVQATDSFGNKEATPAVYTWVIDNSPLTTTLATRPPEFSNDPTGDFTFTNTSTPVTYECKLDSGNWATCTTPYTTTGLTDGSHTLSVRATDGSDVVEDPIVTYTWTVDTSLPDTSITSSPTNPSGNPIGVFVFASTETPVTYQCILDAVMDGGVADGGAGEWTTCPATYTTPSLSDGGHTLQVRAVDRAGNVDGTPVTYAWRVTTDAPLTTIATHPGEFSNDPTGDFTFINTRGPDVTYECKLDQGAFAPCDASYTTPTLEDGAHTLTVRGSVTLTDAGILVEDPGATFTWTIDTAAPNTTIESTPAAVSTSPTGEFTFGSNQAPVTYQCRIDGGAWGACGASYVTPALSNGEHTLDVRAVDRAQNADPTPATFAWRINAVGIDGGVISDGGARDIGPVGLDGGPGLDGGRLDSGAIDTSVVIDVPGISDVRRDVAADSASDVPPSGPEPARDAATVPPEPARDAAVSKQDAPVVTKDDAAVSDEPIKVLGGGFCAIAQTGTSSTAGLAFMALAALALLRRRRR